MRQVTFSSQSLDAISSLPQVGQLSLIEKLSSLSSTEILAKNQSGVGKFVHKGKTFYRIRIDDMRIYLEQDGEALHCQFILEKNSFRIFWYALQYACFGRVCGRKPSRLLGLPRFSQEKIVFPVIILWIKLFL